MGAWFNRVSAVPLFMKNRHVFALLAGCLLGSAPGFAVEQGAYVPDPTFPVQPTPRVLTPEEELKTIQLPPGYHLELVLSDPLIKEPVLCTFDGNGRMYVAEMRTYMQDADRRDELTPGSRVSCHESTRGDGVFDKHTVFLNNALLPRMVLPLDKGQVLIGLTNTFDIDLYSDPGYAGVSGEKKPWYVGGPNGANLEHQPSGLLWSMDNWIYTTYNNFRLRWTPEGPVAKQPTAANGAQWGVAQDSHGKIWWSNAGAEKALYHFQTHILYGAVDVDGQFDPDFMQPWPVTGMADFQGGPLRSRPDKTLNHFTACGGHEVYRGDRLPADLREDVLLPEPAGRLIRRAKVADKDGMTVISNPYQAEHGEFIRSTDPYFRPVYTTTGPDGCLYIVDMYRGIIQEGNWTTPGSYLRKVVDQYGFATNTGHGRIWRLVYDGMKPGPKPHMLDQSAAELVPLLNHPNGWWRDQAQKLIVLRQDRSVVPALMAMPRTSPNPLGRQHALWTLEGLGVVDPALVREKLKDPDAFVRAAAIRVSETLFRKEDLTLKPDVLALARDKAPNVALQVVETAKALRWVGWQNSTLALIASNHVEGVQKIGKGLLYEPRRFDPVVFNPAQVKLLTKGQEIYQGLCFACHGTDGHGMAMEGLPAGTTLAPPLAGSRTVLSPHAAMVSVLLHGVTGPINGKTYDSIMPAQGDNDDEYVAAIVSYVRNSFGNSAPPVSPPEVATVRTRERGRTQPWSLAELQAVVPQPLAGRAQWKLTASEGAESVALALDGQPGTRYTTRVFQHPGEWLQVELPQEATVAGVSLDAGAEGSDFPRGYTVQVSGDGVNWGQPVASGKGTGRLTQAEFAPVRARFVRVTQTAGAKDKFWSVAELQLLEPPKSAPGAGTVVMAKNVGR